MGSTERSGEAESKTILGILPRNNGSGLRHTFSVCPVCLRQLPAEKRISSDGSVRIHRVCPEHGSFDSLVWRGRVDYASWCQDQEPAVSAQQAGETDRMDPDCAHCSGLCQSHRRGTCCTLLEVTKRCNMNCRFCFAHDRRGEDPPLARVKAWIYDLTEPGQTFLQLSGGEPTLRDDLPEITAFARKCGCRYIQLNTNGLRLAEDEEYVRRLAKAGLSFAFLSFDGTTEEIYQILRGRNMLEVKERAIANCEKYGIGVVLVPEIVRGVNDNQIGSIIRYAVRRSPAVRGIHFQPVSFFGRIPDQPRDEDRFTLDELMAEIEFQTHGRVSVDSLKPSDCDHPLCGFHGSYVVAPDGHLLALSSQSAAAAYPAEDYGRKIGGKESLSREFIGCHWSAAPEKAEAAKPEEQPEDTEDSIDLSTTEERDFVDRSSTEKEDSINRSSADEKDSMYRYFRNTIGGNPEPVPVRETAPAAVHPKTDMTDMDTFLERVKIYSFTISSMDFQDAGNLDLERLQSCSLHVYRNGRKIPFCAYYMTPYNIE